MGLSWAGISTTQTYREDFKLRGITKYSERSAQELQKYLHQYKLGFEISEIIDNKKIVLKVMQYLDRAIKSMMQICYKKDEMETITWDQYKSFLKNQFEHPTNRELTVL